MNWWDIGTIVFGALVLYLLWDIASVLKGICDNQVKLGDRLDSIREKLGEIGESRESL